MILQVDICSSEIMVPNKKLTKTKTLSIYDICWDALAEQTIYSKRYLVVLNKQFSVGQYSI